MWTTSYFGIVAVALMSMMIIIAGDGCDAENCREKRTNESESAEVPQTTLNRDRRKDGVVLNETPNIRYTNSEAATMDVVLSKSVVLYGVLSEIINSVGSESDARGVNLTDSCHQEAKLLLDGINARSLWALKALDASGNARASFVWGQRAWTGSETQCHHVHTLTRFTVTPGIPKHMNPELIATISPIALKYRMVFSNFSSPNQIDSMIHLKMFNRLALCAPDSCSDTDLKQAIQMYWDKRTLTTIDLFDISASVVRVRSTEFSNFYTESNAIWIVIGIVTVLVIVITFSSCNAVFPSNGFLLCFSLRKSIESIYNTAESNSETSAINGIRPIICIWIMVIHVPFYSMFAYDNLAEFFQAFEGLLIQVVFAALFYVDIFFMMSGLLLVYNFLKNDVKTMEIRRLTFGQNCKEIGRTLLRRYLRLTPALVFTTGLSHVLALYIGETSTHFADESSDLYCTQKGWWYSLFYIQNFLNIGDMCLSWSWYLACDMQFYTIVLILLYIYAKYPRLSKGLLLLILIACITTGFYICMDNGITFRIDSFFANFDIMYTPPWMRAHPYIAGAIVGYTMVLMKDQKFQMSSMNRVIYWTITTLVLFASLFITYFKDAPPIIFAIIFSVCRPLLSLVWGSMVAVCALGQGGRVQQVLSSRFLCHLDRVSYMMFLLNPVVITALNAGQERGAHFDGASMIFNLFGVVLLTYLASVVATSLIEAPFQRLSDRYLKKCGRTRRI